MLGRAPMASSFILSTRTRPGTLSKKAWSRSGLQRQRTVALDKWSHLTAPLWVRKEGREGRSCGVIWSTWLCGSRHKGRKQIQGKEREEGEVGSTGMQMAERCILLVVPSFVEVCYTPRGLEPWARRCKCIFRCWGRWWGETKHTSDSRGQ